MLVVQGGARGADECARAWCRAAGVRCETMRANWREDGPPAGPARNLRMLAAHPDALVLAFPLPQSRGTWHCVRAARARGMRVVVHEGER